MNNKNESKLFSIFPCPQTGGLCLLLRGNWIPALKDVVEEKGITTLRLSYSAGWRQNEISFVSDLSTLRGIEIYNWDVKDLSPLANLADLEFIGLECGFRGQIEFDKFAHLNSCFVRWRPGAASLLSVGTLKDLNIVNYPHSDLVPIRNLRRLASLKLVSRKLISLKGLENLAGLETLDLFDCPRISDLTSVSQASALVSLQLERCKKIYDLNAIAELGQLRRLVLNNCGHIKTLQPVARCRLLEEMFFVESTNVDDGDMSVLQTLPMLTKVSFANRRHYSHKRDEMQSSLRKES